MTGSCGPYRSTDFGGRETIFVDSDGNADVRTNQENDANHEDYELVDNRHWSRSLGLWMVAIYIVLFLIRPWEILSPWLASFRFERMYAISMICVVVVMGRMPRWNLQTASVLAFTAVVSLSAVYAWQSQLAWHWLYQYVTIVIVYFLILAICRAPRDLFLLILTYIATMFVYLAKSLWEFFVHDRHEHAQSVTRLLGIEETYGEPNSLAMSIVLSLPFWLFLVRSRHALTWQWQSLWKSAYSLLLVGYPCLAIVSVWETNSRAGMLGMAAFALGAVLLQQQPIRWSKAIAIGAIALASLWVITPSTQKERLSTLWDRNAGPENAHASAAGRWEGFLAATEMVKSRPLLGVGIGNFKDYRALFVDGIPLVAHNLPGQIMGEMGLLGGVAFTIMLIAMCLNSYSLLRLSRAQPEADFRVYSNLAQMCLLAIALSLLFGASLHNGVRYNWLWIAAFAGLALQFCRQTVSELDEEEMVAEGGESP